MEIEMAQVVVSATPGAAGTHNEAIFAAIKLISVRCSVLDFFISYAQS